MTKPASVGEYRWMRSCQRASETNIATSVKIEGNAVAIKGATFKSKGDIASKARVLSRLKTP